MTCAILYLHRLSFPSESGQTIQVVRDYGAMAARGHPVHLFYRAERALSRAAIGNAVASYGVRDASQLSFHLIPEGAAGGRRLRHAAATLIEALPGGAQVAIACRTLDHALIAIGLRRSYDRAETGRRVRVVLELHETAIPHMVFREQGRRLRAWWSILRERRVFRAVDGLVATVGSQLTVLDGWLPQHAPAIVLPNGVLPEWVGTPRERVNDGTEFRLRYAGNIGGWKNTDVMIECLKHLPAEVVLDIAGGKLAHTEDTRAALERRAAELGVGGRVRYFGVLPPAAVPAFLAGAHVLLVPLGENVQSRYFTSPMKIFECAASGVPMVVARQPTTESLVTDGVHALMAAPTSAREMGAAVARIIAEPALGARLAANALAWVQQHRYDVRAERYGAFLDQLFRTP